MTSSGDASGDFGFDDLSEYLQIYLDETDEQLDDIVETMLTLEDDPENGPALSAAFRVLHSIKGAAGMMGFDPITALLHHLETRFERLRSGRITLDRTTMNLTLRSIDFLRDSNERLRSGGQLPSPDELLAELHELEAETREATEEQLRRETPPSVSDLVAQATDKELPAETTVEAAEASNETHSEAPLTSETSADAADRSPPDTPAEPVVHHVVLRWSDLPIGEPALQHARDHAATLGDVLATRPDADEFAGHHEDTLDVILRTDRTDEVIMDHFAPVGIAEIELRVPRQPDLPPRVTRSFADHHSGDVNDTSPPGNAHTLGDAHTLGETSIPADGAAIAESGESSTAVDGAEDRPRDTAEEASNASGDHSDRTDDEQTPESAPVQVADARETASVPDEVPPEAQPTESPARSRAARIQETMRVDIDRLDGLMNLAGELVVNQAQFLQVAEEFSGANGGSPSAAAASRKLRDDLREALQRLEQLSGEDREDQLDDVRRKLRDGLQTLDDQTAHETDHRSSARLAEAVDNLGRVTSSLQRGVLSTRMVPVGPLLSRFKRVVRDIAQSSDKEVELIIEGEQTELDKRMIDAIGDPMIHLIRNAIDHGLEGPDERERLDKPRSGTLRLEAMHRGNQVCIKISDDGRGIDTSKIRQRLVERGLCSKARAKAISDEETIQSIFRPGFSTASEVTDISGRGVGMDIVKARIEELNGSIQIESRLGKGTTFTLRMPLTLAIVGSLLVEVDGVILAIPKDDVQEIVAASAQEVVDIGGRRTFETRRRYVPLVHLRELLPLRDPRPTAETSTENASDVADEPPSYTPNEDSVGWTEAFEHGGPSSEIVVVGVGTNLFGLYVDRAIGTQDVVIKSLSDNFETLAGLAGASVLGDGKLALMLDIASLFRMLATVDATTATAVTPGY